MYVWWVECGVVSGVCVGGWSVMGSLGGVRCMCGRVECGG